MKPYVLWIDYGCDGWNPQEFDTPEEALNSIMAGGTYGQKFVLTKILPIVIHEEQGQDAQHLPHQGDKNE